MPTVVPLVAFSATEFTAAFESETAPVSNSSTSLMAIVNAWSVNDPSAEVARTVMFRVGPTLRG